MPQQIDCPKGSSAENHLQITLLTLLSAAIADLGRLFGHKQSTIKHGRDPHESTLNRVIDETCPPIAICFLCMSATMLRVSALHGLILLRQDHPEKHQAIGKFAGHLGIG